MDLITQLLVIIDLLQQVNGITTNQMTVILESLEADSVPHIDEVLEEMSKNKEEIIGAVEEKEIEFEKNYNEQKKSLTDKVYVANLQEKVKEIIELKEKILENEKSNMIIFESKMRKQKEVIELPKNPKKVIDTYKKSQFNKK